MYFNINLFSFNVPQSYPTLKEIQAAKTQTSLSYFSFSFSSFFFLLFFSFARGREFLGYFHFFAFAFLCVYENCKSSPVAFFFSRCQLVGTHAVILSFRVFLSRPFGLSGCLSIRLSAFTDKKTLFCQTDALFIYIFRHQCFMDSQDLRNDSSISFLVRSEVHKVSKVAAAAVKLLTSSGN